MESPAKAILIFAEAASAVAVAAAMPGVALPGSASHSTTPAARSHNRKPIGQPLVTPYGGLPAARHPAAHHRLGRTSPHPPTRFSAIDSVAKPYRGGQAVCTLSASAVQKPVEFVPPATCNAAPAGQERRHE